MVGRFRHIHIHLAGSGAFPAGDAFVSIYLHLEKGYLVQQGVERAQRAEPFAERAVKEHAQHDYRNQHAELPCEQLSQRRPNAGIGKRQRDRPLQHALRAEILAEEGIPHAHIVYKERREQEYHHQQNSIFQVSQGLELPCRQLS